jgi:general secretion pathway protein B
MSYILDALRKSEQERQATEPNSVTDRILVSQPQPIKKPAKWIAAIIISNLLVIASFAWFFTQKAPTEPQQTVTDSQQKPLLPPPVTTQDAINLHSTQPPSKEVESKSPSPSIAQLIEAKKMAAVQQPHTQIPEKKPLAIKKEPLTRKTAVKSPDAEMLETITEKPATLPSRKGILTLDELPYEIRNTLPNLTINVFSYAHQPEDRFVIIDMVKYRTGQLIKGSVKLKEILPNGIVLQYGNNTFRIERP